MPVSTNSSCTRAGAFHNWIGCCCCAAACVSPCFVAPDMFQELEHFNSDNQWIVKVLFWQESIMLTRRMVVMVEQSLNWSMGVKRQKVKFSRILECWRFWRFDRRHWKYILQKCRFWNVHRALVFDSCDLREDSSDEWLSNNNYWYVFIPHGTWAAMLSHMLTQGSSYKYCEL